MRTVSLALSSLLLMAGLTVLAGACGGGEGPASAPADQGRAQPRFVILDDYEPVVQTMAEVERLAGFRPLQLQDGPEGFELRERFASPEGSIVTMSYVAGDGRGLVSIVQWKSDAGGLMDRYRVEAIRGEPVALDGEGGRYLPAEFEVRPFHSLLFERGGVAIRIEASPLTIPKALLVDIAASLA